jgi:hypothetical protein
MHSGTGKADWDSAGPAIGDAGPSSRSTLTPLTGRDLSGRLVLARGEVAGTLDEQCLTRNRD